MADEKQVHTEGWHVVLAVIVLLVLAGYLYYQAKQHPQTGPKKEPLEFFGVPGYSRTPILPIAATPTATPVKVR